jgi:hypothetical protein
LEALVGWVSLLLDVERRRIGRVANRVVSLDCETIPVLWEELFQQFNAKALVMGADGSVECNIEGSRLVIRQLLASLDDELAPETVVEIDPSDEEGHRLLTEREERALAKAVAAGYFEGPCEVQLSELAEDLGSSESALSE